MPFLFSPDTPDPESPTSRTEEAIAAALFVFAVAVFWARAAGRSATESTVAAFVLFGALTGTVLCLSVERFRNRLRAWRSPSLKGVLSAPLAITAAVTLYSAAVDLPVVPRAAAFGLYLTLPALLVGSRDGASPAPARVLAAAVSLWLPIEFDVLPALRLPPPDGFRAAPLIALANGLYLFLIARPVDRIGYTFRLRRRDLGLALLATVAFAVAALPVGVGTGFLEWRPRLQLVPIVVAPLAIYLATAVPEEFLFRGLIQNALERSTGRAGLPIAAVVFGFAHLPDRRYVLLATLAGLAYGWVYVQTRRITAAAVTHALVDWIWVLLLRR